MTRTFALALCVAALAGCATPRQGAPFATWTPSRNVDVRRPVAIVLHQTQIEGVDAALEVLRTRNDGGPVSAHYLVADDGRVLQLVDERDRAWHAGASRWAGFGDLNSLTIGIELDNDGREPFTEAQVAALLRLLDDVSARHRIPRHLVLAHGDVAPTRKADPGPHFPWKRLADAGHGLWPRDPPAPAPAEFDPVAALRLIGYDVADPAAAIRAFHHRYRGHERDGWEPGDIDALHDLQRQLLDPDAGTR